MFKVVLLALIFYAAATTRADDSSNSAEGQFSSNTNSMDSDQSDHTEGRVSSNVQGVVDDNTVIVGRRLLLNATELVSDVDSANSTERSQRRRLCEDTSYGACDRYGDCCPAYHKAKHWCGRYDTHSFQSKRMCCACGGGSSGNSQKPEIELKTTNYFTKVFDDQNTGSRGDVALWRPAVNKPWFGTVASNNYWDASAGGVKGVYAEMASNGMLREPRNWELIWNDSGTGSCNDRSLWKAIPHSGYTCLGHVGKGFGCTSGGHFSNHNTLQNSHMPNYKCVKSEFVEPINVRELDLVWNDVGSGGHRDTSIWKYYSKNGYKLAFASSNYGRPNGPLYDFIPALFN